MAERHRLYRLTPVDVVGEEGESLAEVLEGALEALQSPARRF
jgi:hypothetical protein